MTFKSTSPILPIYEIWIIILVCVLVVLLYKLIYDFIIDNIDTKIISKAGFIGLDKVYGKVYWAVAFRIHSFWLFFYMSIVKFICCWEYWCQKFLCWKAWIRIAGIKNTCAKDACIGVDFVSNSYYIGGTFVKDDDTESPCIWHTYLCGACIGSFGGVSAVKHLEKHSQS